MSGTFEIAAELVGDSDGLARLRPVGLFAPKTTLTHIGMVAGTGMGAQDLLE